MERVLRARAMCRRIGQWIDDLQLLDDRAGPSVRDDERQRIFMFRTNVNEMNVEPVDLGDEVRQGLQLLLDLAPVVLLRPIARERLHRREPRPLRLIFDGLLFGPARRLDASAEVVEFLFRHVDLEGAYLRMGHGGLGHGDLLSVARTSLGHVTGAAYSRVKRMYVPYSTMYQGAPRLPFGAAYSNLKTGP